MTYLQGGFFTGAIQNDWAIILALLILSVLQGYKIYIDAKTNKLKISFDNRLESVMNSIELYLKIISDKYTEEVTDLQMPIIVNEFTGHVEKAILCEMAAIITRNDVDNNRRETEAKITAFICNQYKEMHTNLGRFKWKGRYLNELVPLDNKKKLIENAHDIVMKEKKSERQMMDSYRNLGSSVENHFTDLRNIIKTNAYG